MVISVLPDSLNVLAAEQIPLFCDGEAICPIKPPYSLRITNGTAANTNTIIADCAASVYATLLIPPIASNIKSSMIERTIPVFLYVIMK